MLKLDDSKSIFMNKYSSPMLLTFLVFIGVISLMVLFTTQEAAGENSNTVEMTMSRHFITFSSVVKLLINLFGHLN
jgi:nitrate/TMAO reductase-like tetraheme cytochrome c subunit